MQATLTSDNYVEALKCKNGPSKALKCKNGPKPKIRDKCIWPPKGALGYKRSSNLLWSQGQSEYEWSEVRRPWGRVAHG